MQGALYFRSFLHLPIVESDFIKSNGESASSMASSTLIFCRVSDICVDAHLYSELTRGLGAESDSTREFSVGEYVASC